MKLTVEKTVPAPTLAPSELEERIAQKLTHQDSDLRVVVERSGSTEPAPTQAKRAVSDSQTSANSDK